MGSMRKFSIIAVAALLTACTLDTSSSKPSPSDPITMKSLGLDPNDAFGPADAILPGGAQVVSIDAARERLLQGRPDFISALRTQSVQQDEATQTQLDDQTLATFLVDHPDLQSFIDLTPTFDSRTRLRADGNVDFDAVRVDGTSSTIVTMGTRNRRHVLAEVVRRGGTRQNREDVYRHVFAAVPQIAAVALPDPSTMATLDDTALNNALDELGRVAVSETASAPLNNVLPPAATEVCNEDDGSAYIGSFAVVHDSAGLYAQLSWPFKDKVTCVGDQGLRGTCAAFAVTSALEEHTAIATGVKYALSTQDLYATYKRPLGQWLEDGAWPDELALTEGLAGYVVPRDHSWSYNASRAMTPVMLNPFKSACVLYDGPCSETAHQTPLACFFAEKWFCYWIPVAVEHKVPMFSPSNIALHAHVMTSLTARTTALNLAAALLTWTDQQIVIGFDVRSAFDGASANRAGYVEAKLGGSNRGGHAVHLVAWVPNSRLPSSVTPGAGGGYFVVKNSWGITMADKGYYYVPFAWFADTISDVVAL